MRRLVPERRDVRRRRHPPPRLGRSPRCRPPARRTTARCRFPSRHGPARDRAGRRGHRRHPRLDRRPRRHLASPVRARLATTGTARSSSPAASSPRLPEPDRDLKPLISPATPQPPVHVPARSVRLNEHAPRRRRPASPAARPADFHTFAIRLPYGIHTRRKASPRPLRRRPWATPKAPARASPAPAAPSPAGRPDRTASTDTGSRSRRGSSRSYAPARAPAPSASRPPR